MKTTLVRLLATASFFLLQQPLQALTINIADVLAYPDCRTGLQPGTDDNSAHPTNLTYTVLVSPTNGTLSLRNVFANPSAPDLVLSNGVEFTQADINNGRLYFENSSTNGGSFVVAVRDETATASSTGTVAIALYDPATGSVGQQRAYAAGLGGAVIRDNEGSYASTSFSTPTTGLTPTKYASTYVPNYGLALPQAMLGGRGSDSLTGGWGEDLLIGGSGTDILTGGGEGDTFIFGPVDLGSDTITDFDIAEGDTIDLDGLLAGTAGWLDDHIDLVWDGTNSLLAIDLVGGGAYTDLVVTLSNIQLDHTDAYDLVLQDQLLAGSLKLIPRITVAATDTQASENGNNSGVFTLTRDGDLAADLSVGLALGGAAMNGIDYSSVASTATFAPGIDELTITIDPIADSEIEVPETVELTLLPGSGYVLHDHTQASMLIQDLQTVVEILTVEDVASYNPRVPATVWITRNGPVAVSLEVRLDIDGSVRNGFDCNYIPPTVSFMPGQTTVLLDVRVGDYLGTTSKVLLLSLGENQNYVVGDSSSARLIMTPQRDYFDYWKDREFHGHPDGIAEFAAGDEGNLGIGNLARYAYGMDPHAPDAALLPQLVIRDGRCQVDVHRNPGVLDVQFEVSVSTNLTDWLPAQKIVVPELEDNALIETYQTDTPIISGPEQFMRVKLIYEP